MNIYSNFIPILTDNQIIYFSEGGAGTGDVGGNSVVIWDIILFFDAKRYNSMKLNKSLPLRYQQYRKGSKWHE